jgi:hypothetical protein
MRKFLVCINIVLFVASCGALDDNGGDIIVLSMNRTIDTSMPDSRLCAEFTMTKEELNSYFRVAEEVDSITSNAESIILPCKYEGKIRINNAEYLYEVIAGGTGYIYDSNGWAVKNYLCRSESCCSKFKELC